MTNRRASAHPPRDGQADLAGKIHEITASGSCRLLDQLQQQFPPAVTELLKLPGLGPKRVKTLYDRLKLQTFEELRAAANAEKIRELPGFGARTEEHILQALAARTAGSRGLATPVGSR